MGKKNYKKFFKLEPFCDDTRKIIFKLFGEKGPL